MSRPRIARRLACLGLILGTFGAGDASAQVSGYSNANSPEQVILQALASNPVTSPYRFAVETRGGRYQLLGRVGTKQIHDVAVQTLIALGYPFNDQLVIDTAAVYASPAAVSPFGAVPAGVGGGLGSPGLGVGFGGGGGGGGGGYVYPPPLFGRIDDPFYGLEPPVISFPPGWPQLTAYRRARYLGIGPDGRPLAPPAGLVGAPSLANTPPIAGPADAPIVTNANDPAAGPPIEMSVDPKGVAVLRGTVDTAADRVAIGQQVMQAPGVTEVVNLLTVRDPSAGSGDADRASPPAAFPPPEPELQPREQPAPSAERPAPIVGDAGGDDLSRRLEEAVRRRPALESQPIRILTRDGVATLSGRVPTIYEAMLAFRAAQQTPGVREVVDRLEFVVPDLEGDNPLLRKGRPEDVEPYLEAQIRRQVGDLAHVDRVRVAGDRLEVLGTLGRVDDRNRVEAILRSMPALRGFRLEPEFRAE